MYDFQFKTESFCRELFTVTCDLKKKNTEEDILFTSLLISIYNSIESTFILLENERYWDALILERSVFEGMLRLICLNNGTVEEQVEKFNEFFYLLPEFENLKRYNRARVVNNNNNNKFKQIVEIEKNLEDVIKKTSSIYTKKDRKRIEHKWSVSEMCNSTADLQIEKFDMLLYFYNLSSNFIHKDATSLGIQIEKTFENEKLYYAAFNATILLNMIHVLSISVIYFGKYFKSDLNNQVKTLMKEKTSLFSQLEELRSKWFDNEYK
ncbi:TPA: hypothetical protein LWH83_002526 [Listeria innocua]|uniref:DUF5677 domain-containing protein n=1 Tax=Listeria TaxID=1637 RepID=UPI000D8B5C8D|nr:MULTISPECIES: DUF5677 domain-containing protein [Listeria]EAD5764078.1 hypothetical protein [Listeria innocua]EAE5856183.1 hypothetical protein [Listeria monocytogenes]EAG8533242.1 hypothetical protein [Listeria innocua]EDO1139604.1 hypothetical protein [Listeria innocua]EGX6724726.1 hypothetical protein [Listeria innocua]